MTVKQSEAVKAWKSIRALNGQSLRSAKLAKKIYELSLKLQKAYDFQTQEEQKIFEAHPEFNPAIGGIPLNNKTEEERKIAKEEVKEVGDALKELGELDFDMDDYKPFNIDLDQYEGIIQLSGEDIGNLQKFINFVETEEERPISVPLQIM